MDEDLSNLLRNLGFAIVLIILFLVLFGYVILHRFGGADSSIETKIKEENDIVILVHKSKCQNCWDIKKTLLKHVLFYDTINSDNDKRYQSILKKLELNEKDIVEPTIINVEKGKVVSLLVDIKNIDDLEEFLEYNNLTN